MPLEKECESTLLHLLLKGAEKLAGGEARLAEREPPDSREQCAQDQGRMPEVCESRAKTPRKRWVVERFSHTSGMRL